uniref:Gfo/Idh/MocA-like oxidoreductase N-terminal domain-containing protein n=1 Tax=Haptolina ericina TaxID=156174 RepID=A0A7S3F8J6_9EUKA|mmetsp:Transcript_58736/g.130906  ORF Transcript_58736/g.130906 Transcript_58736/m.130906 type:complete len:380 (+) Transcript_58736:47-1186(+)
MVDKSSLVSKLSTLVASPGERVGFAIVGLGRAGHFHLTSMKAMSDIAELVWVIDTDAALAARVAEREGCQGGGDFGAALADGRVHAVIICSTTNTHYPYCRAALLADKHVFTEKPISHDPEELSAIVDLATRSPRAFIVGYQRRVDPSFRELRRQVHERRSVGSLRLIKCTSRDNPLPPLAYLRVSGGIFYDMLCHDFDMIHFLSGEVPISVYSAAHCYDPNIAAMGDVDQVAVTLTFASGLIAMVDCSRVASYGYDQRVEVFGEEGMATAHNQTDSSVVVASSQGFLHPPSQWSFPQRYRHTYTAELAEFVALIKHGGCESNELIQRHIQLDAVAAAAELSWRLGRVVRLDEVASQRHVLVQAHGGSSSVPAAPIAKL